MSAEDIETRSKEDEVVVVVDVPSNENSADSHCEQRATRYSVIETARG